MPFTTEAPTMLPQWFLGRNQQRYGPYALDHLKAMASSGHVIPSDWLLKEGTQQWVPASSVDVVFPSTGATPPPIPPLPGQPETDQTPKREHPKGIADELHKLQQLRESGVLSDEEFAKGKQAI